MKLLHGLLSAIFCFVLYLPIAAQSIPVDECSVLSNNNAISVTSFQRPRLNNPTRFDSLDDLEPEAADKISARLRKHLGNELGGRIRFRWGYAYKDPDDHTTMYRLQLTFTDKVNGLASYGFEALLAESGESVKVFGMPNLSETPGKGDLIPCSSIAKMADQMGMPKGKRMITFDYDPITDSLVWILFDDARKLVEDELLIGTTKVNVIFIQAHTGKIIRNYETFH